MVKYLLSFICAFVLSVALMPVIIKMLRKKHATQSILGYVETHKDKNGTTTMGGVVFIISTLFLAVILIPFDSEWFVTLLVATFFGLLGFMDDHIKIKYKQNLGLRPYQKIIGQLGISIIFAIFIYFSSQGGKVFVPFSEKEINLDLWIIPLVVLVLLATTNSVNLTDGLDGLAGNVSMFTLIFLVLIFYLLSNKLYLAGETGKIISNINSINTISMLFAGSILGFLMFNTSRASIFMGDVGSLCLGGYVGASACIVGMELLLPILCICFVFSTISVILQVLFFKLTKKRIFKMAPFHHHLQMCGLTESKVVAIYSAITILTGMIVLIFYLL